MRSLIEQKKQKIQGRDETVDHHPAYSDDIYPEEDIPAVYEMYIAEAAL